MAEFSGRLAKAPVVYALCQIRFSPVLKMRELVADIQDKLRDKYDAFEEEQIAGIQIPVNGQPIMQTEHRWRFETGERRSGYLLGNSSFIFHTTSYADFDEFVQEVMRGFKVIIETAKVQRVQRIGLRYVDLIEGDHDNPPEEFLHKQLHGFGSLLNGIEEKLSQYVFTGKTEMGQLILRATRGKHQIPVPPDLLPLTLKVKQPNSEHSSFFLDTDHFIERTDPPIDVSELESTLNALKAPIGTTFKKAITEKAVAAWK